jgi:voltage-gated potassium channel Kch
MDHWIDPVLFFLAATSIPMLIVETGNPSEGDSRLITGASWFIWGAFTLNFVARVLLAHDRRAQVQHLAWDLVLIIGQPLYSIGDRKANAVFAFLRLLVIAGRSLQKGRVLRRTGHKFRAQPLRVVAFIVPFLWLTSAALIYRTETESGVIGSYGDGLWWSAVTMATVGYGDISPKTTNGRAVGVLTMVVGIGMFSLITAKLAELLFIQRTRGTHKDVIERDHTLVLGWSAKVYTIVEQLVIANASRPHASIVVFAPRDHNDMLDDIQAHVPSLLRSTTTVVTRTGSPSDPAELSVCRPDRARSIIIIDDTEEDASVVRTVLSLMNGGHELPDIPIVAEIDNQSTAEALRLALDGRVTVVNPTQFIARTAAQACRSAGIALTYQDLLGFEGSELYLEEVPAAVGHTYGELLRAFPDSCLVGYRRRGGTPDLNPSATTVIGAGDELVLLAADDSKIGFTAPTPIPERATSAPTASTPEHVVIFGWNPLCPLIVRELDGYVPPGSTFTIAIDRTLSARAEAVQLAEAERPLVNAEVVTRFATDTDYADLVEVIAEEDADHALVLCYREGVSVAEADARALVTTLQVRRALESRGRDTTVVTELLDQKDVALAPPSAAGDFIVSDRLVSLLLTQLAENQHLVEVFDDLLDPDGAEVYCNPAERYAPIGAATTFDEVVVAAARRGESAIGYRSVGQSADEAHGFGAVLNPPKATSITFETGDQVIVIADHA